MRHGRMPEAEFQKWLADMIQRYDAAWEKSSKAAGAWEAEWQEVREVLSREQKGRADELLNLHCRNERALRPHLEGP